MDRSEFKQVAKFCGRWNRKTLEMVEAVLVNSKTPADVATEYDVNPRQVREVVKRFRAKHADWNIKRFMAVELPGDANVILEQQKEAISKLHSNGYTAEQIRLYLSRLGYQIESAHIQQFIEGQV